ncbi:MAG: AgmX/PglI C-terminal domain-containing protein [Deltaproteobacteria bacterium]|nr:AgmX/PglI C-terminal domain-containing protein [Deltaproteobacteria bacterium]
MHRILPALLASLLAASASTEDLSGWRSRIESFFSLSHEVKTGPITKPPHAACRDPDLDRLSRKVFAGTVWQATLRSKDPKRYAAIWLTVRQLSAGGDVYALMRRAGAEDPPQCFVGKGPFVAFCALGLWFELRSGCASGEMIWYEAGDLLGQLEQVEGFEPPKEIVYSGCGQMRIQLLPLERLREEAARPRDLWGRRFPEARGVELTRSRIARVIHGSIGKLQACAERHLPKAKNPSGRLRLRWIVRLDGRAAEVRSEADSIDSPGLLPCLYEVISKLRFPVPRSTKPIEVFYPFHVHWIGF